MEIRHFVFGKFQTRSPEFNVWIADSLYTEAKYNFLTNTIINRFNRVFYKNLGYQISELPEVITFHEGLFLYIRFYPSTLEERGSDISNLCHCFIFNAEELSAINFAPWRMRDKFIKSFGGLEITGYNGSQWLTRDEAAERNGAKVIKIETDSIPKAATQRQETIRQFSSYHAVVASDPETALQKLTPQLKLSIFASGVLLKSDVGLVKLLGAGPIHFVFPPPGFESISPNFVRQQQESFSQLEPDILVSFQPADPPFVTNAPAKEKTNERPALEKETYLSQPRASQTESRLEPEPRSVLDAGSQPSPFSQRANFYPETDATQIRVELSGRLEKDGIIILILNKSAFPVLASLSRKRVSEDKYHIVRSNIYIAAYSSHEIADGNIENGKIYTYQASVSPSENTSMLFVAEERVHARPQAPIINSQELSENKVTLLWGSENEFEVGYSLQKMEISHNGSETIVGEINNLQTNYVDNIKPGVKRAYAIATVDVLTKVQSKFTKSMAFTSNSHLASKEIDVPVSSNTFPQYEQAPTAKLKQPEEVGLFQRHYKIAGLFLLLIAASYTFFKLDTSKPGNRDLAVETTTQAENHATRKTESKPSTTGADATIAETGFPLQQSSGLPRNDKPKLAKVVQKKQTLTEREIGNLINTNWTENNVKRISLKEYYNILERQDAILDSLHRIDSTDKIQNNILANEIEKIHFVQRKKLERKQAKLYTLFNKTHEK